MFSIFKRFFLDLVARINWDVLLLLNMILILQIPPPPLLPNAHQQPIYGPISKLCSLFATFNRGVCHFDEHTLCLHAVVPNSVTRVNSTHL